KNGGLGVSSFHALNRALLLKWVWRFLSQDGSLWHRVIQALYGFDFVSHRKKRVGDGHNTRFWYDSWVFDQPLRVRFHRLFALETDKESTVASSWDLLRWICDLNGDGLFRVKEVRTILDDICLPFAADATIWVKSIPIKINVLLGVLGLIVFRLECDTAKLVFRRICRWWDLDWHDLLSFSDWNAWFFAIRLPSRIKLILE
nr:hypothetical protein [Tanacetum cinerariifolium]